MRDHSLIFAQMNISISKKRCYKREIWDFSNVNTFALNQALLLNDLGLLFDIETDIDLSMTCGSKRFMMLSKAIYR